MTETTPPITRSTGIDVAGWYGPRPGGGYSGATSELDAQVVANAEALRVAFGQPVQIRFNSDRRSGGAFLPNGVGISAGLLITRQQWVAMCHRYPDADDAAWLRDMEPEGEGGQLYIAVYAPMTALRDPEVCNSNGGMCTNRETSERIEYRYFSDRFPTLEASLEWVRVHMNLPERHCLRCRKDLTDVMGVYVFVGGKPVDGLLCVEHGANGSNNLSADVYERLTHGQAALFEDENRRGGAMKDYGDRIEELAQRYEPRALDILNRIRAELVHAGVDCVEPYQMFDDNYRWAFATKDAAGHVGEGSLDYTIEIAEQRDYDGADADPGINFGLSVVEWGGLIRGQFNPYNFTPDVWVDAYDDDAVESRWRVFAEVDVDAAAKLAIPTPD